MFWYACGMYQALYHRVLILYIHDMSEGGHIVYKSNRKTVGQKNTKNGEKRSAKSKLTKRGLNQTNEGPT